MDNFSKFKDAVLECESATRRAHAAMIEAFPVGCTVRWEHGSHTRSAVVTERHNYRLDLSVASPAGKKYWIPAERIDSVHHGDNGDIALPKHNPRSSKLVPR